jgi:hypothetical protein
LSTLLEPDIGDWLNAIRELLNHVQLKHDQAVIESFDADHNNVLIVPPKIRQHLHRIYELDGPAQQLSIAVACAESARRLEPRVRAALRSGADDREGVIELFSSHLGTAGEALVRASNAVNERIFATPKRRPLWKRILIG